MDRQPRSLQFVLLVALAALAAFPLVGDKFYLQLVTKILIMAMFAMSLDLLVGYTGLVSLGHALPFGAHRLGNAAHGHGEEGVGHCRHRVCHARLRGGIGEALRKIARSVRHLTGHSRLRGEKEHGREHKAGGSSEGHGA